MKFDFLYIKTRLTTLINNIANKTLDNDDKQNYHFFRLKLLVKKDTDTFKTQSRFDHKGIYSFEAKE